MLPIILAYFGIGAALALAGSGYSVAIGNGMPLGTTIAWITVAWPMWLGVWAYSLITGDLM